MTSSLLALFFLNFFVLCFLPTSPSFIQIPQNEILWITILPVFSQFLWTLRFIFSGFGKRSSLVLLQIANYRKSSIKPPLSNKPLLSNKRPLFRGGKLISVPPSLHPYSSQTINVYWSVMAFRLEVHIVFGLRPHDLQLHVLNFFNFTLYCYHFLIVRKSSITPGNHKSVVEKPCSRWCISLNWISPPSL